MPGSEQLEPWIKALYERYGSQVDIDGVADVSMVPTPLRAVVRALFRKRLTHSVMLDWDGSVVKRLEYKRGVANIYVLDRSGTILKRITGPLKASLERELFRTIDGAIAADRPGERIALRVAVDPGDFRIGGWHFAPQ